MFYIGIAKMYCQSLPITAFWLWWAGSLDDALTMVEAATTAKINTFIGGVKGLSRQNIIISIYCAKDIGTFLSRGEMLR